MPPAADLWALLPEFWLTGLGVVLLLLLAVLPSRQGNLVGWLAIVGLVLALVPTWGLTSTLQGPGRVALFQSYAVDGFAIFFKFLVILATILVILAAMDYYRSPGEGGQVNERSRGEPAGASWRRAEAGRGEAEQVGGARTPFEGEVYVLFVFAALAFMLMAASADLVLLALSIEFASLTSYVLAGYLKGQARSNEAGLKYFLYGAAASAAMFYGFTILYGLTGSTNLYAIADRLRGTPVPTQTLALALMLAGIGFKISMVPFHQWTPDVYEGAPTPVAAFLSVASKAAGFAVLLRVLVVGFLPAGLDWVTLIAVLSAISMFLGNLLALPQRNIKRLLAYSTISHAGFILIGVAAFGADSANVGLFDNIGFMVYLFAYLFTNLGAFFVVGLIGVRLGSDDLDAYAGLGTRAPFLALLMVFFMLSLVGTPPTAGFFAKLYVLGAAVQIRSLLWLAIVGIVNSVISLFYYVGIIRAIYLTPAPDPTPIEEPAAMRVALGIAGLGTLLVGIFPNPLITLLTRSAALLLRL